MGLTSTVKVKLYKVKMGELSILVIAFNKENAVYNAYKVAKGVTKGSNEGMKKFREQITGIDELFSVEPDCEHIFF